MEIYKKNLRIFWGQQEEVENLFSSSSGCVV
jgi:hypothetical protein